MEAAAGRGGSLAVSSSQPARKEWRAVSEHPFRNNGVEEQEHVKLGLSDERTIYEVQEGTGPLDVDFCSITIVGGGLNDDILQQRLQSITRQREELQQREIELRAQVIARMEISEVQNSYEEQIKEHANAAVELKEQLQEREQQLHELEMKLEEKDRELRAMKIDNEAAWAKEDLLREQNKELATFRRERDNLEAERAQHLKKIRDLQEHIQEKENQFLALEEQHRVAQETILYKDEQLREAQTWIARIREMDALQSTTNQSLQAELRERTEHFNQCWLGLQQQFVEMERHHLQAIQQLQLELADARERSGIYKDNSQVSHENSKGLSSYAQSKGNQINANDGGTINGNMGLLPNGNLDGGSSFVSASNASIKSEHGAGVPVVPSSIIGMGAFLPPGQMTALHPYVMHPQGVPQSVSSTNSPIPQSQMGHFQPLSTIPAHQQRQNQQEVPDISQLPNQNKYQPSQSEQNLLRPDANYRFELAAERQVVHPDHLHNHISQQQRSSPVISGSSEEVQVLKLNGKPYPVSQEPQDTLNANSQFSPTLGFEPPEQDKKTVAAVNQSQETVLTSGQQQSSSVVESVPPNNSVSSNIAAEYNENEMSFPEVSVSAVRTPSSMIPGKFVEPTLLDERSLLACIVRAIPAGSDGRVRISTTLPNRLAKMLAPLHWHDYKKHYGKLDDFVAHHQELFVIEGDHIHLREGAQEIISATTAVAKVAAAAASSAPYSSLLPSVAVTPVAQSNRQKKLLSVDSRTANNVSFMEGAALTNLGDSYDKHSEISQVHDQQSNGVSFNIIQGLLDVKISSKSKNLEDLNGLSSEMRSGHSSIHITVGNGTNLDRTNLRSTQNKGLSNGRHGVGGKQQGRSSGAGLISRR
ncbi:uncharacterized protein LOC103721343 isoform X3 [Phoenix dactylifera]|uniref:Uncharacterized protein LOC103721343 isoform X3 n=1 Tax=Phoenix dactylifera TaxID=42345 RepID=A0A8B8JC74_PHODC|nr:uncharacterized protein LOC103721343 isoform X3 [Phoenix dactylifera]